MNRININDWMPKLIGEIVAKRGSPPLSVDRLAPYYRAAAVLVSFLPDSLIPLGGGSSLGTQPELSRFLSDCVLITDSKGLPRWSLNGAIRRKALLSFSSSADLQEALKTNPRSEDLLQLALDAAILGKPKPIEEQDEKELAATLQVLEWLSGVPAVESLALPNPEVVRNRMGLVQVLSPLRRLVGAYFSGRSEQLQMLRNYVVKAADLAVPPLVIRGVGGIGKSSLLARFALEIGGSQSTDSAFAFLDFDRPEMDVDDPAALLLEAARQLSPQNRSLVSKCQFFIKQLTAELNSASRSSRMAGKVEPRWIEEFAGLFVENDAPKCFVLLFDTFEEIQYRSRELVSTFWNFLAELRKAAKPVRVILAGRSSVEPLHSDPYRLTGLDADSARTCLIAQGVPSGEADRCVEEVGGNPLSLRLVAELFRRDSEAGGNPAHLTIGRTHRYGDALVQGYLFRRILDYIHNDEVRKLAHPGLVLRRVTPQLINLVLAGPCEVVIDDEKHLLGLFNELAKETSLVTPDEGDDALHIDPDVRRAILGLIQRDKTAQFEQINLNAIAFYEKLNNVHARAEELYHRLLLGQRAETIRPRWQDEAERFLRRNIDELPPLSQVFLAAHSPVGLEILTPEGQKAVGQAHLVEWELLTARRIRDLLRIGRPGGARPLLRERIARTAESPLYLAEASVAMELGHYSRARDTLEEGLKRSQDGATPHRLGLMLGAVRLGVLEGDFARVRQHLVIAQEFARKVGTAADRLEAAVYAVLMAEDPIARTELRRSLADRLRETSEPQLAESSTLARSAAVELLGEDPQEVQRVVTIAGLGNVSLDARNGLGEALAEWETDLAKSRVAANTPLRSTLGLPEGGEPYRLWREWAIRQTPTDLAAGVNFLMKFDKLPPRLLGALAELLRGPTSNLARGKANLTQWRENPMGTRRRLYEALLDAFTIGELNRMVNLEFSIHASEIFLPQSSMSEAAYRLIEWAERRGTFDQLLRGALRVNPGNRLLRSLAKVGLLSESLRPPSVPNEVTPNPVARLLTLLRLISNGLSADSTPKIRHAFAREHDSLLATLDVLLVESDFRVIFRQITDAIQTQSSPLPPAEIICREDSIRRTFKNHRIRNPIIRNLGRVYAALRAKVEDFRSVAELFKEPRLFSEKVSTEVDFALKEQENRGRRHAKSRMSPNAASSLQRIHWLLLGSMAILMASFDSVTGIRTDLQLPLFSLGCVFLVPNTS